MVIKLRCFRWSANAELQASGVSFSLGFIGHLVRLHGDREEIARSKNVLAHECFHGFGKRCLDKSHMKRFNYFFFHAFSWEKAFKNSFSHLVPDVTIAITQVYSLYGIVRSRPVFRFPHNRCYSITYKLFHLTLNKSFGNMLSVVDCIPTS